MSKQISGQAYWVALGTGLAMVVSILGTSILSRYLTKPDYGTYRQLLYIYNSALVLFTAGLPNVFSYFLPRIDLDKGYNFVKKITYFLFALGTIFSFSLYLGAKYISLVLNNSNLEHSVKLFSILPILLLPTLGIEGILATYNKSYLITINTVVSKLILLSLWILPLFLFGINLDNLIYGWLLASFINLCISFYIRSLPFKNSKPVPDNIKPKEIFSYSLPIVFASIFGILISASYQFYLSRKFGAEVFAEYSNGFIDIPIISIVAGSIGTVIMPKFSKLFLEEGGVQKIGLLFSSALLNSALIIYPISVFFIAFSQEVIILLYSVKYAESSQYFFCNNILNFFNIIIFSPLLLALGQSKFYANLHIVVAFLAWILGYLLYKFSFIPISYAILSVLLTIFMIVFSLFFVSKLLKVRVTELVPVKQLLIILFHCGILCFGVKLLLLFLIPDFNLIALFFTTGSLFVFLLGFTSRFFKINYLQPISPLIGIFKF